MHSSMFCVCLAEPRPLSAVCHHSQAGRLRRWPVRCVAYFLPRTCQLPMFQNISLTRACSHQSHLYFGLFVFSIMYFLIYYFALSSFLTSILNHFFMRLMNKFDFKNSGNPTVYNMDVCKFIFIESKIRNQFFQKNKKDVTFPLSDSSEKRQA